MSINMAIDFSEVKGIEPVPVDTYLATIQTATEGESNTGNPKIDLQWKIESGQYAGRIIFDTLAFTQNSMFRVKNTLIGLGFPKNFKGAVEASELVGKTAMITVDIQTSTQLDDNGDPYPARNRIKKVKSV